MVGVGALLVALGVALLLANTLTLRHNAEVTRTGDTYLVAAINVERLVVDAETGLRGYVITRRPLFLAPTREAQARFPGVEATLRRAAEADGSFARQAAALEAAASTYMRGYVPAAERLTASQPAQASSVATTLAGKRLVDAVRTRSVALQQLLSARQRTHQNAARRAASAATTEAIVVLVLLTVVTLLLGALLGRLVIARERARTQAEQTNAALQQSLLPGALPAIPGYEVAVRFRPAGEGELVGGDFYDVFTVGEDQWAVVVGDVCGKGHQAAALTAMARWTLRSLAGAPVQPADALRFLNRSMLSLNLGGRFITMAYLLVEPGAEGARATLACAGHPPAIHVPARGEPRSLPAHGPLLGVWPDIALESCEVTLAPGDSVVLYTDGVSDPGPGPQRLPVEALRDRPAGAGADQLAGALEAYAAEMPAPQRDDIAIVAIRRSERRSAGPGPSSPVEAGERPVSRVQ